MRSVNTSMPLLSGRGLLLCVLLSIVLCWPTWIFSSHFVFADTGSYFRGGGAIWKTLIALLPDLWAPETAQTDGAVPAQGAANLTTDASGASTVGRSFTYSAIVYAVYFVLGYSALPVLQAFIALIFVSALVDNEMVKKPLILFGGFVLIAGLSTLPWYSAYLMPDLFAGTIILYAALLIGRYDDLSRRQCVIFTTLAAILVTFHYGYPPLMAGLAALILIWRVFQRRLSIGFVAAAIIPLFFAPLLNMAASSAVLGEASATPQRLPILLARSLEDGPAYWYLQDACPGAGHALCEIFGDELPDNVGEFLWDETGVTGMNAVKMNRIRDEELEVLVKAFAAYPWSQTQSLLGNAAKQAIMIGTGNIAAASGFDTRHNPVRSTADEVAPQALRAFDTIVVWATWIMSVPLILLMAMGLLSRQQIAIAAVAVTGILLNATIFGGLSAPVERYQSRVIWLLPVLSMLFMASWLGKRRPT
ncbi:MAG: hypothetical protein AAGG57_05040 [Pseudomonadota bacterium]